MAKFRYALIALACVASAGTAAAQTTVITREPAQTRTVIKLTPAQRTTIYRSVVHEPAAVSGGAVTEYRVGTRVPADVRLQALPPAVVTEVPAIRTYKYMVVNNQVVLVDPATSEVVEEISE
ncbi:MAG TPA: DUF1236 domain-containing protein [Pseudolabrys sp.]|nr:DUF1236 domain-containing protein [Pseudolabrys sp.]